MDEQFNETSKTLKGKHKSSCLRGDSRNTAIQNNAKAN